MSIETWVLSKGVGNFYLTHPDGRTVRMVGKPLIHKGGKP